MKSNENANNRVERYSSGTKWEEAYAYSRAIRKGNIIHVAGTTAVNDSGEIVGLGNMTEQTTFIFNKIETALKALGGRLEDVVRTRVYIVEGADWEAAAKVHGQVFRNIRPAETLLMISSLVNSDLLVEIEAEAILA